MESEAAMFMWHQPHDRARLDAMCTPCKVGSCKWCVFCAVLCCNTLDG